jgi:hypothetical protein
MNIETNRNEHAALARAYAMNMMEASLKHSVRVNALGQALSDLVYQTAVDACTAEMTEEGSLVNTAIVQGAIVQLCARISSILWDVMERPERSAHETMLHKAAFIRAVQMQMGGMSMAVLNVPYELGLRLDIPCVDVTKRDPEVANA